MKEANGIPCPRCGSTERTVMETRQHHQRIRRRSVCANCETRYTTAEFRVDQLQDCSQVLASHQAATLLDSIQSMEESLNTLRRQIEAALLLDP
jgi:transcriptional regulator NrdR family protein